MHQTPAPQLLTRTRVTPKPFAPPTLLPVPQPKLAMNVQLESPPEALMTERSPSFDNPLSRLTGGGPGSSGVPGTGIGGGGTRGGPGSGNIGTVYKGGDGITLPVLLHQVD